MVNHVPWSSAEHRIRAEAASAETAGLLQITPGFPCLVIDRQTWRGEQSITWVRQMFLGDAYDLVARFAPGARNQG